MCEPCAAIRYHPLVSGHKNERIKAISKETGATIHVPPSSKAIDEIIITGEKKGVELAATKIKAIYDTLQVTCGELSASIKKSQHRCVTRPFRPVVLLPYALAPPALFERTTCARHRPQT